MDLKAKRQTGRQYPNGSSKSRLHEVFLCFRDFHCSPQTYEETLWFIRREEAAGKANCAWFEDVDGMLVVEDLDLKDERLRVVITENSFQFGPRPENIPRVFISYAREDFPSAQKVAEAVRSAGLHPWLDTIDLRPGEPWEVVITKAIRSSNFVVVLLSNNSVNKRGYFHKEIRNAIEEYEQMPESKIFLIPARLELCEPPHLTLRKLQWVDLFPDWETGIRKLLASFEVPS